MIEAVARPDAAGEIELSADDILPYPVDRLLIRPVT